MRLSTFVLGETCCPCWFPTQRQLARMRWKWNVRGLGKKVQASLNKVSICSLLAHPYCGWQAKGHARLTGFTFGQGLTQTVEDRDAILVPVWVNQRMPDWLHLKGAFLIYPMEHIWQREFSWPEVKCLAYLFWVFPNHTSPNGVYFSILYLSPLQCSGQWSQASG